MNSKTLKQYTTAAENGHADAQTFLGLIYDKGIEVPVDFKIAVKWYTLAPEQDVAIAQHSLGVMYYNGHGVRKDFTVAYMWLKLSK